MDDRLPAGSAGPRIVYLDLLRAGALQGWDEQLARYAALGFDSVLIAPPFLPGPDGSVFHPADVARLHPVLGWSESARSGLQEIAAACARHGLRPMLDVVLHRVAAHTPLSATAADVFATSGRRASDPRTGGHDPNFAYARAETSAEAEQLGAFWGRQMGSWHDAGIAGFRLLGLDHLPGNALPHLLTAAREHAHGGLLLGWTPGLDWNVLPRLVGAGLDYVFSSFAWWDWRADWIWEEWDLLARIAPVIACPEAPYAPRLAAVSHDPATLRPFYRRSLGMAALLGNGWMMQAGFEHAVAEPMDERFAVHGRQRLDLRADVDAANRLRRETQLLTGAGGQRLLTSPNGPVLAVLRTDTPDARRAKEAALILANADLAHTHSAFASALLPNTGACFATFTNIEGRISFGAGDQLLLAPGDVRVLTARAEPIVGVAGKLQPAPATAAAAAPRLAITGVSPAIPESDRPVKRVAGESVAVEADILCDGHDQLGVALLWRRSGNGDWRETRMRPLGNDRWRGEFPLPAIGSYEFTVEAWRDAFATFQDELGKKHTAGVPTSLELREGRALVEAASRRAPALQAVLAAFDAADEERQRALLLSPETAQLMKDADDRPFRVRLEPSRRVEAERTAARFASWYEIFPRSMSDDPARHGTFDDVIRHLPRIRDMGFDVLYFPPIHPIGHTNRKGRNNSLRAAPDDPGSPYAIGSEDGGHDSIHPQLGSFADFARLQAAAATHGLEIALDFAIQCSPDHPWLREHKDWFDWRPDGSLRYAENPPKKYEDIVNVDFYADGAIPDLWLALCNVVLFWCDKGIRLFRVDNPHTKPFPFWEWLIAEVRARHPDAIFLSEAFTRPKIMYRLAEIGFSQSYTYFTWRSTKQELRDYLQELTTTAPKEFFRPHFFVNTPDINPVFLQSSGRPGFLIRAALAATMSGLWGVYNGFELCEGRPIPGREEYLDSEKYEIRAWDWNRPGNIVAEIAQLNRIRRTNPALQSHLGITFLNAWNDAILFYEKATPDRSNVVLVAVSLDPVQPQEADIDLPLWRWSLPDTATLDAEDLATGSRFAWHGKRQRIRLTPESPYSIWRVRPTA